MSPHPRLILKHLNETLNQGVLMSTPLSPTSLSSPAQAAALPLESTPPQRAVKAQGSDDMQQVQAAW